MESLVLDLGNTRAKIYLFSNDEIVEKFVFVNEEEEAIQACIGSLHFEHCIISATAHIPSFIEKLVPKAIELTHQLTFPFKNLYSTPATLGTDRIALVAGAILKHPGKNVLIIDTGSCITYDFVSKDAEYLGGAISPGLTMRLQSLHTFTDKLPFVSPREKYDFSLIGKSTKSSIQSGAILGAIAEVDGIINDYRTNYKDLTVLMSGGDHEMFALHMKNEIFAHSDLQAIGLNHILKNNAY